MKIRTINISLVPELIDRIDTQAANEYTTRSGYIRRAIIEQLKIDEVISDIGVEKITNEAKRKRLKTFIEKSLEEQDEQR